MNIRHCNKCVKQNTRPHSAMKTASILNKIHKHTAKSKNSLLNDFSLVLNTLSRLRGELTQTHLTRASGAARQHTTVHAGLLQGSEGHQRTSPHVCVTLGLNEEIEHLADRSRGLLL